MTIDETADEGHDARTSGWPTGSLRDPGGVGLRPRTRVAVAVGRALGRVSRAIGLGYGTVVGGVAAELVEPRVLEHLARSRVCVLVTGTNGKSTTSHMLAEALATAGRVALNGAGSNMDEGLVMALAADHRASRAVLEVDEAVLGRVAPRIRPAAIVLLNLNREHTRGVLLRSIESSWLAAMEAIDWPCVVVANADDPLVVAVARHAPAVTWVAAGLAWGRDAAICPVCLAPLNLDRMEWACGACGLARPSPDWTLREATLDGPGVQLEFALRAPGRWNATNAAFAVAAATELGLDSRVAACAAEDVVDVAGRYVPHAIGDHEIRLFLVKNPSSWQEAVTLAGAGVPVIIALEAFGIKDMTPQWDVDMTPLAATEVAVAGHRRLDIAVLLEAQEVPHRVFTTVAAALEVLPSGPVSIVCNYTAFLDLKLELAHR